MSHIKVNICFPDTGSEDESLREVPMTLEEFCETFGFTKREAIRHYMEDSPFLAIDGDTDEDVIIVIPELEDSEEYHCNYPDCCCCECESCDSEDEKDDEEDDLDDGFSIHFDNIDALCRLIQTYIDSPGVYDKVAAARATLLNGAHIMRNTEKRITTVCWGDGTITMVRAADDETMNDYHAFTAALAKRIIGNNTLVTRIVKSTKEVGDSKKKKGQETPVADNAEEAADKPEKA